MKVNVVGGGPAGLYFSLLLKKSLPDADITIVERNAAGATYGFGVVFSDRTLTSFREADYKTYERITDNFIIWDAIDVRYRDRIVRCGGQVFSGIARKKLLTLLQERCLELGVQIDFDRELSSLDELSAADLVVGADGVRSLVRATREEAFGPRVTHGRAKYIWYGTKRVFDSFTFAFRDGEHGFFQAHAYPFDGEMSTFIVECSERTWSNAGLDQGSEAESIAFCESLFEDDLQGHSLISNASKWINFVNLKTRRWHSRNHVLVGDAAHTAHFSIGSGTKLAMEDSIALVNALTTKPDVASALVDYQLERKPRVERFQEAARQSQTYFENTARYKHMEPLQFAFHLLSRSGRMDYDDLRVRDRHFVGAVDGWFAHGEESKAVVAPPAALTPLTLRGLQLSNRLAVALPPGGVPGPDAPRRAAVTGAALVIVGPLAVSSEGRIAQSDLGLYEDAHAETWRAGLRGLSPEVAFVASLNHAGPRAATSERSAATDRALQHGAWQPLAASEQRYGRGSLSALEIDREAMKRIEQDFATAATRALEAGFRVLEVQMGHGYLLGSFVSPLTNHRSDAYGEERLRYPLEVFDAVRNVLPNDVPLGVALSASDWKKGGLRLSDAASAARTFKERGCDFVRVLAGQTVSRYRPQYDPYFLTYLSDVLRNEAGIRTIATGDISTVDHANTIVAGGRADLCLLRI